MNAKSLKEQVMHVMAGNLSCQDLTDLITDYLEGCLSLTDKIRFQIHLGLCIGCRTYLSQMKTTIETLGQLPPEPMPDHVRDELMARFRNWKKPEA